MSDRMTSKDLQLSLPTLRSVEPELFEPVYRRLVRCIHASKHAVLAAMKVEKSSRARGVLIELLGETKDPALVPILEREISANNLEVAFWAFVALYRIGTDQAIELTRIYLDRVRTAKATERTYE